MTSIPSEFIEASLKGTGLGGAVGVACKLLDSSLSTKQLTTGWSTGCVIFSPQTD